MEAWSLKLKEPCENPHLLDIAIVFNMTSWKVEHLGCCTQQRNPWWARTPPNQMIQRNSTVDIVFTLYKNVPYNDSTVSHVDQLHHKAIEFRRRRRLQLAPVVGTISGTLLSVAVETSVKSGFPAHPQSSSAHQVGSQFRQ